MKEKGIRQENMECEMNKRMQELRKQSINERRKKGRKEIREEGRK